MTVLLLLAVPGCGPSPTSPGDADTDTDTDADTDTDTDADPTLGDPSLLCQVSVACSGNILDEPKVPCEMEVVSGDGVNVYSGPAGIELRGRSSLTFPKPHYGLELRTYAGLPIWPGFTWHYLEDGSDQGTAWRALSYDDSHWEEGAAPLGYGEDYLNTVLTGTPTTTWLRYTFVPGQVAEIHTLELGVIRNDGVAVYLNGTEVLRDNLDPLAGHLTRATVALSADEEIEWVTAEVDPSLLLDGANILAVEIHQAEAVDDEARRARFDLYLEAAGADEDVDLFGMGHESHWILNGQYLDRVLFRNRLVFDLFQSLGDDARYAPESLFCELTLEGAYAGVYTLGERIDEDGSRIDLHEGSPGSSFIIKLDDEDGFHPNAVGYGTWQLVFPDPSPQAETEVGEWLDGWEAAIAGGAGADIFARVDRESAVDFVLISELAKNVDAYQLSVHLWKDTDGLAYFTPWDFDLSFGYPYYDCGAEGWVPREPYIDAMAADPEFHAALVARWELLRGGELSEAAILARIAGYDATLGAAVARNFERWPIDDIAFSTGEVDNWLCPVGTYEEEHARVLTFLSARLAWMDAHIATF